jgi:hypothetical protein
MKKSTIFLIVLMAVFSTSALVLLYSKKNNESVTIPAPVTSLIPTEKAIPTTDPVADWETYNGQNFGYSNNTYNGYSFMYPNNCILKNETLSCSFKNGVASLLINASGHGGSEGNYKVLVDNQTKNIASIEGKLTAIEDIDNKTVFGTYWMNKTAELAQEPIFGFEFFDINTLDFSEFQTLFTLILSTFKFNL